MKKEIKNQTINISNSLKKRVKKFFSEEIKKYFLYFSEYLYIKAYNKNFLSW